ncbi:hypothetical protein D0Z07_9313 [Hyphodiscus hymeniophilus]|uniref:Uncharacterized protein n=1 Tax=Hyphodiscus hymeniophilus TaxID=353542 RepID=A0A9P6SPV8_9HELO|nr:hypothetical protein D0Z07_9313 [Hyphodiscus hymeniophilus]
MDLDHKTEVQFTESIAQSSGNKFQTLLGELFESSELSTATKLDWALIKLDPSYLSLAQLRPGEFFPADRELIESLNGSGKLRQKPVPLTKAAVYVITASSSIIDGIVFPNPTYVQHSGDSAFQEIWRVRLNGPLLACFMAML